LFFPWPGFGDAPADPAIRSLDDLYDWFVQRVPDGASNLVAQSMGGVLAMRFAIERPDRVRRLVLVATSGGTRTRFGVDWRAGFRAENAIVPDWFERDRTELDERLGAIWAPTLLLFGDKDPIAPVAMGEHLRSLLRHARLRIVKGGTHVFAEEQPDEVARAVDEHLSGG
jgi:pimeloyl-ACP methyl ester carboxylesterase